MGKALLGELSCAGTGHVLFVIFYPNQLVAAVQMRDVFSGCLGNSITIPKIISNGHIRFNRVAL